MAIDSAGNLWFTESNATVNQIGRLSVPYVFQVSASPTPQTVNRGQTATYNVKVTLTGGIPLPTQLSLVNVPPSVTALFNPQTQNPPFTSTLTIATTNSTPTGTYLMNIQANSGGQNQTTPIALTVQIAPPPPPPTFGVHNQYDQYDKCDNSARRIRFFRLGGQPHEWNSQVRKPKLHWPPASRDCFIHGPQRTTDVSF